MEAVVLGLGGLWMGVAPNPERMAAVREALSIPDSLEPFAIVAIGYPAEDRPQEERYDEKRIHHA